MFNHEASYSDENIVCSKLRKMLKTLYAEQKKRHRFIEQSFRLCGRRRGWDVFKRTASKHVYYQG